MLGVKLEAVAEMMNTHLKLRFDIEEYILGQKLMEFMCYNPKYYEPILPWRKSRQ